MSLVYLALAVVALLIYVVGISMFLAVLRLVKLPLRNPRWVVIPRENVPEDVKEILSSRTDELLGRGFRYVHTRCHAPVVVGDDVTATYSDVYYSPERDLHAEVHPATLPSPRIVADIHIWNGFSDGSGLLTVDGCGHLLFPLPRAITVTDVMAGSLDTQIERHIDERSKRNAAVMPLPAMLDFARRVADRSISALIGGRRALEDIELNGRRRPRLSVGTAIRYLMGVQRGERQRKQLDRPFVAAAAQAAKGFPVPPHLTLVDPELVRRAEERVIKSTLATLASQRLPRRIALSLLLLSAGAFLAVGVPILGAETAAVVAVVVLFHEFGHLTAMRLAGYRDTHVFFVPGLGAATVGMRDDAPPLARLLVYLGGPLPGIVLGLGLAALVGYDLIPDKLMPPWLGTLVWSAIIINYLNLLPLMPLDGGRVVDTFIGARMPWLGMIFRGGSALGLVAAGFYTGDAILRGLGIVLLFTLPHQYRLAATNAALKKKFGLQAPGSLSEAASRLNAVFREVAGMRMTLPQRVALVHELQSTLRARLPHWRETLGVMTVYFGLVAAVPVLAMAAYLGAPELMRNYVAASIPSASATPEEQVQLAAERKEDEAAVSEAQRAQATARLAAATTPKEKFRILMQLASDDTTITDRLGFALDAHRLAALMENNAFDHAEAAYQLARLSPVLASKLEWLDEAERKVRAHREKVTDEPGAMLLADILMLRNQLDGGPAVRAERLREVLTLRRPSLGAVAPPVYEAHRSLAEALSQAGDISGAEAELAKAIAAAEAEVADEKDRRAAVFHLKAAKVDYFLSLHQPDAARLAAADLRKLGSLSNSEQQQVLLLEALAERQARQWTKVDELAAARQALGEQTRAQAREQLGWFAALAARARDRKFVDQASALLRYEAAVARGDPAASGDIKSALHHWHSLAYMPRCTPAAAPETAGWHAAAMRPLWELEDQLGFCRRPKGRAADAAHG